MVERPFDALTAIVISVMGYTSSMWRVFTPVYREVYFPASQYLNGMAWEVVASAYYESNIFRVCFEKSRPESR
ncbi:hypothetical protein AC579_3787 [Pseudocercospora musae]|uniref:Uncharacterized protein n=1 Tax=Pseudocercospora musae TaxID=113226 RepID=A0A139I139_9PEZI|nr:hypothetical protein AC579_3787 [Pseudocercospora musae]